VGDMLVVLKRSCVTRPTHVFMFVYAKCFVCSR